MKLSSKLKNILKKEKQKEKETSLVNKIDESRKKLVHDEEGIAYDILFGEQIKKFNELVEENKKVPEENGKNTKLADYLSRARKNMKEKIAQESIRNEEKQEEVSENNVEPKKSNVNYKENIESKEKEPIWYRNIVVDAKELEKNGKHIDDDVLKQIEEQRKLDEEQREKNIGDKGIGLAEMELLHSNKRKFTGKKSGIEKAKELMNKMMHKCKKHIVIAGIFMSGIKFKYTGKINTKENKKEQNNIENETIKQSKNKKKINFKKFGVIAGMTLATMSGISYLVYHGVLNNNNNIEVEDSMDKKKEDKVKNTNNIKEGKEDKKENVQIEDDKDKYKKENTLENSNKQNNKKENNKKENNKKEKKDKKQRQKDIMKYVTTEIAIGSKLPPMGNEKFTETPEGKGRTGTFKNHDDEELKITQITVIPKDGKYVAITEKGTNLYDLKKKYPDARFACHIDDLGFVSARKAISKKMDELGFAKVNRKHRIKANEKINNKKVQYDDAR